MPAALLGQAVTRVHQDDREIRVRRTRDHVPGVFRVSRSVGEDEGSRRGLKVTVRDIDGDALFPFGP